MTLDDASGSRRRLVVETDGGARGNPGPAGWGAVIRDATGAVLAERADYLGISTNNVAEYAGLVAGLRAARAIDAAAEVEVRADSKLLVEQMSGRWQIKNDALRRLAAQARAAFPPEHVHYRWIPRAENTVADALANEAMDLRVTVVRDFDPARPAGEWSPVVEPPAPDDAHVDEPHVAPPVGTASRPAQAELSLDGPDAAPGRPAAGPTPGPADGGATREPVDEALGAATAPTGRPAAPAVGDSAETGPPPAARALGSAFVVTHDEPLTLVLVRHGQTDTTAAHAYAGGDTPGLSLNARGRSEAARAADLVHRIGREVWQDLPRAGVVLSSSMLRSQQTAAAIGRRIGVAVRINDAFAECRFGEWNGLTPAQIDERWPGLLLRWHRDPSMRALGGESMQDVAARVRGALPGLLDAYAGRTVVVASHTIAIRATVGAVTLLEPASWPMIRLPPASLTIVRLWPDGHELTVVGCPSDL